MVNYCILLWSIFKNNIMKTSSIGILLFSAMLFLSCKQGTDKTTDTIETKTIEKETVIVRDTVKPEEGTSIKVSKEGVKIDSKDVKVDVK